MAAYVEGGYVARVGNNHQRFYVSDTVGAPNLSVPAKCKHPQVP